MVMLEIKENIFVYKRYINGHCYKIFIFLNQFKSNFYDSTRGNTVNVLPSSIQAMPLAIIVTPQLKCCNMSMTTEWFLMGLLRYW